MIIAQDSDALYTHLNEDEDHGQKECDILKIGWNQHLAITMLFLDDVFSNFTRLCKILKQNIGNFVKWAKIVASGSIFFFYFKCKPHKFVFNMKNMIILILKRKGWIFWKV